MRNLMVLNLFKWHCVTFGLGFGCGIAKGVMEDLATERTEEVKTLLAKTSFYLAAVVQFPALIGLTVSGWILTEGQDFNFYILQVIALFGAGRRAWGSYKRHQAAERKDWKTYDSYHFKGGVVVYLRSFFFFQILPFALDAISNVLTGTHSGQSNGFEILSI
jgi:hypothetical protein